MKMLDHSDFQTVTRLLALVASLWFSGCDASKTTPSEQSPIQQIAEDSAHVNDGFKTIVHAIGQGVTDAVFEMLRQMSDALKIDDKSEAELLHVAYGGVSHPEIKIYLFRTFPNLEVPTSAEFHIDNENLIRFCRIPTNCEPPAAVIAYRSASGEPVVDRIFLSDGNDGWIEQNIQFDEHWLDSDTPTENAE